MVKASKIQQFWEARSSQYGQDPRGVLPKALPAPILSYLDDWMYLQVKKVISPKEKVRVLDLGCGYGRLASKIVKDYPNAYVVGVDIAQRYIDLYNENLGTRGNAIKADIRKLPFKDKSFDVVIAVTAMMYVLNAKDQDRAFGETFRILKNGGKFVFIERNPFAQSVVTLGGFVTLLRGRSNKEIQAVSYTPKHMLDLINEAGGSIERCWGLPFWTIFLPLEGLASFFGKYAQIPFGIIRSLDDRFGSLLTPSLYISYIGSSIKRKSQ